MKRQFAILLFFIAATAMAGERFDQKPLAEGFISSVDPYLRSVTIDGGQLTIDITTAEVRDGFNQPTSPTNLRPGLHVATVIRPGDYGPGDALSASVIQILQQPVGTITGKIESVDTATSSFVVLGQRIYVTSDTHFRGSVLDHDPQSLAAMQIGDTVTVFLDGSSFALRAAEIYTIPPTFQDRAVAFTTTVTKIDGKTWTVRPVHFDTFTVSTLKLVSGTSVQGIVFPGDTIEVFARVDGDQVTPESIQPGRTQCPNFVPFPVLNLRGTITAISATSVTIADADGTLTTIILNEDTVYAVNDPQAGDYVSIEVEKHGETFTARRIVLEQFFDVDVVDTVKSVAGNVWTIGTHVVFTNARTAITGDPKPGDRVHLVAITVGPDKVLALRIDKQ